MKLKNGGSLLPYTYTARVKSKTAKVLYVKKE